ncbi:stress up-regulated Nod 19 protein [Medicago truncatula]|uniref:Stress up-regulated Nod 19 protein n=1 Tax=Medicago truncatula TaxID=3880 RepID=G7J0F4_MEDTR|nr:stress up-regulated Nod 19 protein [Medicago truncatula]
MISMVNRCPPDYKGGIFCCHNGFLCKLRKGFQAPRRKLALRYKIMWVELMGPTKNPYKKKKWWLSYIYGTAHMHTGVVNATLYGQDGRTLCTTTLMSDTNRIRIKSKIKRWIWGKK